MTDIIYNVLTRPIPSEPDQKDVYHLDKVAKDAKIKQVDSDDPQPGGQQQNQAKQKDPKTEDEQNKQANDKDATKQGKGKYTDKDGVEHLDIFV